MFAHRMQALQLFREIYLSPGYDFDPQPLGERVFRLAGNVVFRHEQYRKPPEPEWEDNAILIYEPLQSPDAGIHLYFFLSPHSGRNSILQKGSVDWCNLFYLHFPPESLGSIPVSHSRSDGLSGILQSTHPHAFRQSIMLCHKKLGIAEAMQEIPQRESIQQLYLSAHAQMMLLYSLEACELPGQAEFSFCQTRGDRDHDQKILKARDILLQRLGNPITIPELSRKVAMNECYLKKRFKELMGSTIFEFYQKERMNYAKGLLFEKGLSVTEVSAVLGYSSISHFSTAFKRHTGLKPCELLIR